MRIEHLWILNYEYCTSFEIISADDFLEEGEGTVSELHGNSAESFLGLRNIDEMENDGLVVTKHISIGDTEEEGVADLTGCSCDGNSDRVFKLGLNEVWLTKAFSRVLETMFILKLIYL